MAENVRILNARFKKALILEEPDPTLDAYLIEQGIEVERLPLSMTQDVEAVLERLRQGQHDLLYKRSRFEVDEAVLEASSKLAAIMLCCIGDDSVDKEACARHGVLVMNDPISNARSVVELVFGEMICLARRIFESNEETHRHEWNKHSKQRYEIKGKRLGIVGLGNIGKQVARMAEAFDMEVIFYDDRELASEVGAALGWTRTSSLTELFRESDIVTVHVSAENWEGRSNKNMLTYEHFEAMSEHRGDNAPKIFINAGRGFLFEPEDLTRAIEAGHVMRAAVDVFPEEPGSKRDAWENKYAEQHNVITTPHIGAATQEAQPRIARYVSRTTFHFNMSGAVRSCVYAPGQEIDVDTDRPSYVLAVVHSDKRGTKKAINDALFDAGCNNFESSHRDFVDYGFAYDVSAIDKPLTDEQLQELIERASAISGDPSAIRSIRQIKLM